MPHHNRARLAEISEKGLDPTKKHVAGKNGALIDSTKVAKNKDEEKKEQQKVEIEQNQTVDIDPGSLDKLELKEELENPRLEDEETKHLEEEKKSQIKKKQKFKFKPTLESES
jgi:hypothetical protein